MKDKLKIARGEIKDANAAAEEAKADAIKAQAEADAKPTTSKPIKQIGRTAGTPSSQAAGPQSSSQTESDSFAPNFFSGLVSAMLGMSALVANS